MEQVRDRRGLRIAAGLFGLSLLSLALAAFAADLELDPNLRRILAIGGGALTLVAAPIGLTLLSAHFTGLRRLTLALHGIVEQPGRTLSPHPPQEIDGEPARLWRAIALLSHRRSPEQQWTDRLGSILAALPQPVIVITRHGLVTLANQAALDLFGRNQLSPGTSVFDVIDRRTIEPYAHATADKPTAAIDLALANGAVCQAHLRTLPDQAGMVIAIDNPSEGAAGLVHALDLHEEIPPRASPQAQTSLEELTVMVLDCETTGLNVAFDRLLSLAAVRVQGARLVRTETIDVLFDPGEPIPPTSTAIHGITDAMVMAEKPLAERWAEVEPLLRDCVVVGHNIGFDLTILETELRRAGIAWRRPPSLCTLQLVSVLDPALTDLNLEAVAQAYGIVVAGRHTALGDALVTAEVYLHLLALMQARGDRTLRDAQTRAASARRVIREQQAAGW